MICVVASQRWGCAFDLRSRGLCPCVCLGGSTPSSSKHVLERQTGNSKLPEGVSASGCLSSYVAAWWTGQPAGTGCTTPLGPRSVGEDDGWKVDGWMFATDQLAEMSRLYFIVNYVKLGLDYSHMLFWCVCSHTHQTWTLTSTKVPLSSRTFVLSIHLYHSFMSVFYLFVAGWVGTRLNFPQDH